MTPEERAEKIKGSFSFNIGDNFILRELANEIAAEIRAAVEEATEDLIWNLAGCSTFAMGYGLDEPFDKSKARAAMFDVHKLALKYRTAKADAYKDAASLITTLLQKCGPNSDQRTTLERAKAVIEVRAAEVCK